MTARFPPDWRRSVPGGFAGMFCLVLAVEALIGRRLADLSSYHVLNARYAGAQARRGAVGSDVLCLGDSQVKFGVDPVVIERRSGRRAFNLAIAASPPPSSFYLLRRALDAGARPSAVLIGHMVINGDFRKQADLFSGLVGPPECLELAREAKDADYLARLILGECAPSISARGPIRVAVRDALAARLVGQAKARDHWRRWREHRGAEILAETSGFDGRMEPDLEASVYSARWKVYAPYERYVGRLARLAASRGIVVYWLIAPIAPEAQARREALGLDAHHTKNLRAIQAKYPNLVVLDGRRARVPASAFYDSCHLNGRGASWLSAAIATALGRPRDGAAWVELPAYTEELARAATAGGRAG
jgi:hypothetical protein